MTGYIAARLSRTPTVQIRSCLAACAFPNSTGMVITLLTVIHDQFRNSTELGRIDPTAFLSVYMLLYPVLQWGVGGWLLAPDEAKDHSEESNEKIIGNNNNNAGMTTEASPLLPPQLQETFNLVQQQQPSSSQTKASIGSENGSGYLRRSIKHILNFEPRQSPARTAGQEEFGGIISVHHNHHHVSSIKPSNDENHRWISTGYVDTSSSALDAMVRELSFSSFSHHDSVDGIQAPPKMRKIRSINQNASSGYLLPHPESELENHNPHDGPIEIDAALMTTTAGTPSRKQIQTMQGADILPLTETLLRIASKVFQPPVIASLLGLAIASVPELRGLFENIWGNKGAEAPLKFAFDGIYAVG
jgi:predicted permease